MQAAKTKAKQIPAIEGWFTWPPSDKPSLIGSRCAECGDYFFPKTKNCRNPYCDNRDAIEEAHLSRIGKLWSFTINHYQPPSPYKALGAFEPFGVAVVELPDEKLKIQGQVATGHASEALKIGDTMEVVLETLHQDEDGNDVIVWKFKPTSKG